MARLRAPGFRGTLLCLAAGVAFSVSPILIQVAYAHGAAVTGVLAWRYLAATALLVGVAGRKILLVPPKAAIGAFILGAVVYAGDAALTESIYLGNLATLGDLGYLDEDGYLFVVDRRKDMVITGGANVYPAEVEAVLVTHPNVAEVAVIGLPDDEYGELVTAIVVPVGELTVAEVIAFAREHLVRYKAPRRVEFVTELPRDPMGKVRKRTLRVQFS